MGFNEYLDVFGACGRGEMHVDSLLAYYGVLLLFTGDNGYFALASDGPILRPCSDRLTECSLRITTTPRYSASASRH